MGFEAKCSFAHGWIIDALFALDDQDDGWILDLECLFQLFPCFRRIGVRVAITARVELGEDLRADATSDKDRHKVGDQHRLATSNEQIAELYEHVRTPFLILY